MRISPLRRTHDRTRLVLLAAAISLGCTACGGSSTTHAGDMALPDASLGDANLSDARMGDASPGDAGEGATYPFSCPDETSTIVAGKNTLYAAGQQRTFYVDFPTDTSQPVGVLFSWHGYGQNATDFRTGAALDPDADPTHPVIVVTPEDSGLQPPAGLGWDIAQGRPGDANVDVAFFEAMLGCLAAQQPIDAERIYSFGFSAGSVMTSLLYSRHPTLFAAIVNESGAWMNDPDEVSLIDLHGLFTVDWEWPALDPAGGADVLLTHGGPTDVTVFNILDLEKSALAAVPFLNAANRTVVECTHTLGHALDPDVTPALISQFFSAHRAGQPSPYAEDSFDGFPERCTLHVP